jgi:hypothetical protein
MSVRQLEALFRAVPAGIAVGRGIRCERVEVNAGFAEMLGVSEDAAVSFAGRETAQLSFRILDETGSEISVPDLPLQLAARTGEAVLGVRSS